MVERTPVSFDKKRTNPVRLWSVAARDGHRHNTLQQRITQLHTPNEDAREHNEH